MEVGNYREPVHASSRLAGKRLMVNMDMSGMIEKVRLFSGLTQAQLSWVVDRLHTRTVPAGVDLIVAGTPGEVVYFILKGTVKVYIPQIDGTQVIVTIMGPGDTVGERH